MTSTTRPMNTLDLNGSWTVHRANTSDAVPATVPGCVHLDFLAAGKIADPFYRDIEQQVAWVADEDWVYSRTFDVADDLLCHDKVLLHCEGLDTLAIVTLNGKDIGRVDNMFRSWEFDIKRVLKPGRNLIEIKFASALRYTKSRQEKRYIHSWMNRLGVQYLRKEQCNYGWDWGPRLITCGIWRPIRIEGWSGARIGELHITQDHSDAKCVRLCTGVQLTPARRGAAGFFQLEARLTLNGRKIAKAKTVCGGNACHVFEFEVRNPKLWWPNGLGDQPLYELTVELRNAAGDIIDSQKKRVGIRALSLDRHKDEWGESFQFVANGVPFFAKGANWIPADVFAARVSHDRYRDLLQSAADANMNMIRVWGGGIYEQDVFYDICDELGICVWQDFMFACACYPTFDRAFRRNVEAEARENVRRLRHHPSIVLWCGNNELEQGICGPEWTIHQMPWTEYAKIFDRILPEAVRELDPGRDYWPGSPHNPGPNRRDCNNADSGDAHLWAVWMGREPFEWYRRQFHRFCSEFGFQSLPHPRTIQSFTSPEDRDISSYVMDFHQRSVGTGLIMSYLLSWFRMPRDFDSLVWVSQILHGMAIKYAVEHWRRQMPRSMGTVYWQLNDTWPGPTWSSIDYYGRWKACHYLARRFFAPVLVSLLEDAEKQSIEVWASNDLRETISATLRVTITDASGKELRSLSRGVRLQKLRSVNIATIDLSSEFETHDARNLLVWAELQCPGKADSRNLASVARPKHLELRDPGIRWRVRRAAGGSQQVILSCRHVALYVWMDLHDGDARFSDNFFDMRPGQQYVIDIVGKPLERLQQRLRVCSLFDTVATPPG